MSPSDRLDDRLQTAVWPSDTGVPLELFAEAIAATVRQARPIRERAAATWQWRCQLAATVDKRRSN